MSFKSFNTEIWSKCILDERNKSAIAIRLCWNTYSGSIERRGDSVRIMCLTGPTIKNFPENGIIDEPKSLENGYLIADQVYEEYDIKVEDIDKLKTVNDIKLAVHKKAVKYAKALDSYIYKLALKNVIPENLLDYTVVTKLTSTNLLDVVQKHVQS